MPNPFFQLEQLANGVFGGISSDAGMTVSNAGIGDFGSFTLVWDATASPLAAQVLKSEAQMLTGKPVRYVVNSHHHLDHIRGNQVFSEASIVSSRTTRALGDERLSRFISDSDGFSATLRRLEALDQGTLHLVQQKILDAQILELRSELEIIESFVPTLPTLTFSSALEFHGETRSAQILEFGGHTGSDSVLWLPEDGVLFAGDLVLVAHLGFIGHGNPTRWLKTLDSLAALPIQRLVPGHGSVTDATAIPKMRAYLLEMQRLATLESDEIPDAWHGWGLLEGFSANLEFLRSKLG